MYSYSCQHPQVFLSLHPCKQVVLQYSKSQWKHQFYIFFSFYQVAIPQGSKSRFNADERLRDSNHSKGSTLFLLFLILQSQIIDTAFFYQRWSVGSFVFTFKRFHSAEMKGNSPPPLFPAECWFLTELCLLPFPCLFMNSTEKLQILYCLFQSLI